MIRKRDSSELDSSKNTERQIKPKLLSVLGKVNNMENNNQQHPSPPKIVLKTTIKNDLPTKTERPQVQEVHLKADTIERNRRMFAGIMSHLGRAKDRLESDSTAIEKQASIAAAVLQKRQEDAKKQAEQRRKLQELEKRRADITRAISTVQTEIDELNRLSVQYQENQERYKYFLLTDTEPPIYWVPKEHNERTKSLLEARQTQIQTIIAEREIQDKRKLIPIEHHLQELNKQLSQLEDTEEKKSDDIDVVIANNEENDANNLKETNETDEINKDESPVGVNDDN